jgi:hypothetical protein
MPLSGTETPVSRARRRPPRTTPIVLGLLLVAAASAAWYLFSRPTLVFTNGLAAPIWVAIGENGPLRLVPDGTVRLPLSGRGAQVLQWNLARPLSADERPMGEELRGSLVIRDPRGTIHHTASVRATGSDYFAPLISNDSEDLLRITVNAGLEGAVDCGCAVRPGARRVFIGYYRLYRNSTVRAKTGDGRSATFPDLGPNVITPDGTVRLRFEAKDLRPS